MGFIKKKVTIEDVERDLQAHREKFEAGDMIVVGDTIGVVVEDVGVASDFILVYEAEKIVVPKVATEGRKGSLCPGQTIYYDRRKKAVIGCSGPFRKKCGIALENAGTIDREVLIDLMVME